MSLTWYVDPGHGKASAVAVSDGRALKGLGWIKHGTEPAAKHGWVRHLAPTYEGACRLESPDLVVIERPWAYPGSDVPPNDLIDLALSGFLNLPPCGEVISVTPAIWKGQVKKPPHHARAWRELEATERALFPADTGEKIEAACRSLAFGKKPSYAWKTGDLLDATALMLHHLGRLNR